jgi:putative ABC transport system permease protein
LTTYLLVRTGPDAASLASAVREQIWSVDRRQPVTVITMQQILADSLQRRRFTLVLLASFASMALTLAVVGIYGVIAYSVVQRTREFGIRMALGAQRADVLAMVLRESCRLFIVGFGIGIAASLVLSRTMRSMLYGVGAGDPATFVAVSLLFLAAALAAAWAPARRATRVDPMVALRYE